MMIGRGGGRGMVKIFTSGLWDEAEQCLQSFSTVCGKHLNDHGGGGGGYIYCMTQKLDFSVVLMYSFPLSLFRQNVGSIRRSILQRCPC